MLADRRRDCRGRQLGAWSVDGDSGPAMAGVPEQRQKLCSLSAPCHPVATAA